MKISFIFLFVHTQRLVLKNFEIDFAVPDQGPMGRSQTNVMLHAPLMWVIPNKCAVIRQFMWVTHTNTQFGWILSNGLEGDSLTDRQIDG